MNTTYIGLRNNEFKKFIINLLKKGKLKNKYINILTDEKGMIEYSKAFTAESIDKNNNYEIYEQKGDVTANKFIVDYCYRRFPQLNCTSGVKVVARLKINYGAKVSFAPIAENLGFWPYISAIVDSENKKLKTRNRHKKDLLEDCLESFLGCTEYLLDNQYKPGVGYGIVYDILADIFDKKDISLKYNDLYDAKTRLKETFDAFKDLGSWTFIDIRENVIVTSIVYQVPQNEEKKPLKKRIGDEIKNFPRPTWIKLGTGTGSKKDEAQQNAAEIGLQTLNKDGWVKDIPEEYEYFCKKPNN